jgi:hypothetical protein
MRPGDGELIAGGTLGALAIAEAATAVTVCPLCVIGAPILIGIGAYKKLTESSGKKTDSRV